MYHRTVLIDLPRNEEVDIKFDNVEYNVSTGYRGKKKSILKGVSGYFKSGELTAIMGPSGAGKSSLLNLLTGFLNLNIKGDIEFMNNETQQIIKSSRKVTCYIQQNDQLFPLFTTFETMKIAANLKIGNSLNDKIKEILINDLLATLDLIKVKETQCRYLSGGQKKRLSIALELIDNPPVMFLDEPTTGLDSSSTLQCITMLQNLTRNGRTIICTIHQPSAGIYEMFDHIYLLAEGQCVYQGAPTNTVEFFKRIGLQCPKYHNPADYMIEVASKEYGDFNEKLVMTTSNSDVNCWRSRSCNKSLINSISDHVAVTTTPTTIITQSNVNNDEKSIISISPPSEFSRFCVLFNRCTKQLYRDWTVTHLKMILNFLVGILLGLFYVNAGSDGSKSINNIGFLMITMVYLCYTSMMPAVLRFPSELSILKKERFNNWYQLRTYYLASLIANLPPQALFTIVYCSVSYLMSNQPLDWQRFFMFTISAILVSLIAESLGLIIGTLCDPINGTFFGAVLTCIMFLFSGFLVLFRDMPIFMYYITYASYLKYSLEALVTSIYGYNREKLPCPIDYCHYASPKLILHEFSMASERFWLDIGILFINLILLRIIAYCTLKKNLLKAT